MKPEILYLGDDTLAAQAGYLAGVMSYYRLPFDYVSTKSKFPSELLKKDYRLIIVSDYPAANFTAIQTAAIAEKVKNGMGFLMLGGWESFTGAGGNYNSTIFAEVLPVIMKGQDDRVNLSSPCLVIKETGHKITDALPFDSSTPAIGGLNAFEVKQNAELLLSALEFRASRDADTIRFKQHSSYPLLVLGQYGSGRTAAYASDVAPHWVGPLVDWGDKRLTAKADNSEAIEVGNWYAEFFANLIRWLAVKNS